MNALKIIMSYNYMNLIHFFFVSFSTWASLALCNYICSKSATMFRRAMDQSKPNSHVFVNFPVPVLALPGKGWGGGCRRGLFILAKHMSLITHLTELTDIIHLFIISIAALHFQIAFIIRES